MSLLDWLLGKQGKPQPEVKRMTEEELYDGVVRAMDLERKMAARNEQALQAARVRLQQRRAQGQ